MIDSLYIAASGLQAQQLQVDAIANNLANVSTTAYKKDRVNFEDLLYRELARSRRGAGIGAGAAEAAFLSGSGVGVASGGKIFTPGDLKKTELPFDLAIRGSGFFEVTLPNGTRAYTRAGAFQRDRDGQLATAQGYALNPAIRIPPDATVVTIEGDGKVRATVAGESQPVDIGQLELADFVNPGGLRSIGDNLLVPTDRSGDAFFGKPGEQALGTVAQGFLEASNVKLVEEFVNLVIAQRAYEANAKAVQAADEMLSMGNNLRR